MDQKIHGVRALIYHNDKLLILKRDTFDKYDAGLWDLPGGSIMEGEDLRDAIAREILEETGIGKSEIEIKDSVGVFSGEIQGKNFCSMFFSCISKTPKIKLSSEHIEYLWINPKDVEKYQYGIAIRVVRHLLVKEE